MDVLRQLFILCSLLAVSCLVHAQSLNSDRDGKAIFYFPDGKVSSEGLMRDGRPDGYWVSFHFNGVKKSEGRRTNFLLDSVWVFYNVFGDTLEKISYLNGKRNGFTYHFYHRGDDKEFAKNVVKEQLLFVNDKRSGKSLYFYNDGTIKRVEYYISDKLQGEILEFNEMGSLQTKLLYNKGILYQRVPVNRLSKENLREGIWYELDEEYRISREMAYKNGQLHGTLKNFNTAGDLVLLERYKEGLPDAADINDENPVDIVSAYDEQGKIVSVKAFKSGVPVGVHRFYDTTGKVVNSLVYSENGRLLSEGILSDEGIKSGSWRYFHDDGTIRSKGNFINNQRVGRWDFFDLHGRIEQVGNYRSDLLDGEWVWYFDHGAVRKKENFLNGKEEGLFVEYNRDGLIISEGEYFDGFKEGVWRYRINNYKETGSYIGGQRNDKWVMYDDDGKLFFEGFFILDTPDGWHRFYHGNGTLREEQYYSQGRREKTWRKFNESGQLIIAITYKNDREIKIDGARITEDRQVLAF